MSTIERGYNLPTDNFTLVPNTWARDRRLSRRARGLLIELMSHRAGWRTSVATLAKTGTEGEAAIKSAIKELETIGYLERSIETDERGRRTGTRYVITDPGQKETPSSEPSGENHPMDTEGDDPSGENRTPEAPETGDSPLVDFPPVADTPPKKNTLQEEHLREDFQEENLRRRVVDGTHDRTSASRNAAAAGIQFEQKKIDELVKELRRHGLTASFRKLNAAGRTEVAGLVDRCGTKQLVKTAKQMHRPDSPARFVQAWLSTWHELPDDRRGGAATSVDCEHGWVGEDEFGRAVRCQCRAGAA